MRRAMRGTDWGILIVLIFALAAASAFILDPGTPIGTSFERYAFRAADIAASLREGQIYPRWTDEALGGYGAPIPHFTAPLPGMVTGLLDLTLIADPAVTVTLAFVASLCLSAVAVYSWVARRFDATAGLTASLLYLFNPFIGYAIPHILGDLTLMISAALLPLLLWGADRLRQHDDAIDILFPTLTLAALWLTDPRCAALGGAAAWVLLLTHPRRRPRLWLHWIGAVLCGTAIAACFWLPALVEAAQIFWLLPDNQPYIAAALPGLFALPSGHDPAAMMPQLPVTLGTVPLLVSAIGLVITWRIDGQTRRFLLLMAAANGVMTFGILMQPGAIWLLVPLALGLAATATAPLLLRSHLPASLGRLLPVALCALGVGSVMQPWMSARSGLIDRGQRDFSASAQVAFEQQGYGSATVALGQSVPATIPASFAQDAALIRSYLVGAPIKAVTVAGSARLGMIDTYAHLLRMQVETQSATTIHILTANFPGWTAELSGEAVTLDSTDDPLLTIRLPENTRGELVIAQRATPVRTAGWLVSIAGGLGCIALTFRRRQQRVSTLEADFDLLSRSETRLFGVLLLGMIGLLALPYLTPDAARVFGWRPEAGIGLAHSQSLDIRSDVGLELIGVDPYRSSVSPGDELNITLYWRTLHPLDALYRVQLALRDRSTGRLDTLSVVRHPGDLPTSRWQPRRYARDLWRIAVPSSLTPGQYEIVVTAFTCRSDCETRETVSFFAANGTALGSVIALPTAIVVTDS